MKYLALILAAAPALATGQVTPGFAAMEIERLKHFLEDVSVPGVFEQCSMLADRGVPSNLQIVKVPYDGLKDGKQLEKQISCAAARLGVERAVSLYQQPQIAAACRGHEHEEEPVTAKRVYGMIDLPMNCRERAENLALFLPWLENDKWGRF